MSRIMEGFLRRCLLILRKIKFCSKKDNGQSSIEFLISFFFVLGFVFVFLKISLNAAEGYLVHYATYMASRSYLVAEQNSVDPINSSKAFRRAKTAYQSIFKVGFAKLQDNFTIADCRHLIEWL